MTMVRQVPGECHHSVEPTLESPSDQAGQVWGRVHLQLVLQRYLPSTAEADSTRGLWGLAPQGVHLVLRGWGWYNRSVGACSPR